MSPSSPAFCRRVIRAFDLELCLKARLGQRLPRVCQGSVAQWGYVRPRQTAPSAAPPSWPCLAALRRPAAPQRFGGRKAATKVRGQRSKQEPLRTGRIGSSHAPPANRGRRWGSFRSSPPGRSGQSKTALRPSRAERLDDGLRRFQLERDWRQDNHDLGRFFCMPKLKTTTATTLQQSGKGPKVSVGPTLTQTPRRFDLKEAIPGHVSNNHPSCITQSAHVSQSQKQNGLRFPKRAGTCALFFPLGGGRCLAGLVPNRASQSRPWRSGAKEENKAVLHNPMC